MKNEIYLSTNELLEAVKALETFLNILRQVKGDKYYWKWAIIALHNSIQGFMVCALRGSSNLAVLTPECAKAWTDSDQNGKPYPEEKLDNFLNLYKKIKSNLMVQYTHSKKFAPKGQEGRSIKKLNKLRNDFIHFAPRGWSLEVSGLPRLCTDILSIIRFIVDSSGNIDFFPLHSKLEKRCSDNLTRASAILKEIKRAYND